MSQIPFISADSKAAELSLRVFLLALVLTVLLAMSNAYLALKLGLLTSASIPAAILSMGILRFFKNPSLLENNAVQTAASAGEAVAGGIVYTIPALIIIGFWDHFDYVTNCLIALTGGVLGVLFSIPLRRILVHDKGLHFPEGRAIAEVLKTSTQRVGELWDILLGGIVGALLELFQVGFKIIASSWNYWFVWHRALMGFGVGFSATMIGAGYLIGPSMASSIFLGALVAWVGALPLVSFDKVEIIIQHSPLEALSLLWNSQLRYMGIGAMLFAGVWTFAKLAKPLIHSLKGSRLFYKFSYAKDSKLRTDQDMPLSYLVIGIVIMTVVLSLLFGYIFPLDTVGLHGYKGWLVEGFAVAYVLFIGFLFSVITAYFSGMVGVTASPGSSVVIAGMLFAAWLLLCCLNLMLPLPLSIQQIHAAEAITIVIGSVVTGIAAIANDNTQDLKVGQLVGATPWKQQLMLLFGVLVSSLVIPPVMQLLFNVYGIAGVMPHPGMDLSQSLPAPTAALMAAITEAVFRHTLPWDMFLLGSAVIAAIILLNRMVSAKPLLSILGVAMGMYLPLSSSVPLFIGGMIAHLVQRGLQKMNTETNRNRSQRGTLIACGLVAGSAIMDVLLAIPFSLAHSPDTLQLVGPGWENAGAWLGVLFTIVLAVWIRRRVIR